jgi:hypothetical protein
LRMSSGRDQKTRGKRQENNSFHFSFRSEVARYGTNDTESVEH